MNRRDFFALPLAALAVAKAKVFTPSVPAISRRTVGPVSERDVDLLMDATNGKRGFISFQGWRVLWTGWKSSPETIDMVSQVVIAPVKHKQWEPFDGIRVFCIPMPGAIGFINRGEQINTCLRYPQMGFGIESVYFDSDEERDSYLDRGKRTLIRLALEAMRGAIRFYKEPNVAGITSKPWVYEWKTSELSWQSQFYLDPARYTEKATGIREIGLNAATMDRLKEELYGIKRA